MESEDLCEHDYISDVMASMGWQNSFVPVATETAKKLLDGIKFLGEKKLERNDALDVQEKEASRVGGLLSTADYEFDQSLKLFTAHKSQYSTEHHLFKLAEHEESKFKQFLKEIEKIEKDLIQEKVNCKNEQEKVNASTDKLAEGVQWAKSALAEWRQVMTSGEETKKLIEKFCRMDAGRAEALDSKRKLLHESIIKKKSVLVNVYEEKKALELLLERTSQLYRQAHMERRHLVNTWKDAVSQMNQRETEIKATEVEITTAITVSVDKRASLERQEELLKTKQIENRETELYIQELNITSSNLRNRLLKLEDSISLKNSELLALRKAVQNESQKLNNLRSQNRHMLVEEKDKETALQTNIGELKTMREKYEKFKNNNSNAQERLKQIEEMLEAEFKNKKTIQDETIRLNSTLYRSEQQLKKLQEAEKNLTLESVALDAGIARTRASYKNLEKELFRQTEVLYNVDYNIQAAEMRLANMKGTVNEEESKRLESRRRHLEKVQIEKAKAEDHMKVQIARIEEDMRKLSNIYQSSVAEYERIVERLKEKKISVEGAIKQQKILHQQNQEKLVEQNLLKIKVAQMEKQIAKQSDKSYSLERHKMELEAAMNDRLIDVKSQTNLLTMKRKCLIDEKSQLKADIGERLLKIEQLKKRYELSTDLLGKNDDGTTVTAVQIKIEMAQEKYFLLNQGNEMNEKVLKAEDETRRMENTLKLMNFSNDEYRKVFETVTESSPEIKRMNELKNKHFQVTDDTKNIKRNSIVIVEDIELLEQQKDELVKEFEDVLRTKLDNNDALLKIHKELVDQETKLERADRDMKTSFKSAKKRIKDQEFINLYEKDIEIKERDERNNSSLQQLADLVECTPDMSQTVTRHFLERGLSLPMNVRRAKSQCSWQSEPSLGNQSLKTDSHCLKRYSHRSILSGSSTPSSSSSKCSTRGSTKTIAAQSGLSVVKISFPETKKAPKALSKKAKK